MIPDFQSIMRPVLEHLSDGLEHANSDTLEAMASTFNVSADERAQLLPSGKQPIFVNRVAWAKSHLKGAGLIESPRRAVYRITDAGRNLLRRVPGRIDMKVLEEFESYREFRGGSKETGDRHDRGALRELNTELTPEELIDYGNKLIREQLSAEILEQIRRCPPEFFEKLVINVLVAMGYGGSPSRRRAGRRTKRRRWN